MIEYFHLIPDKIKLLVNCGANLMHKDGKNRSILLYALEKLERNWFRHSQQNANKYCEMVNPIIETLMMYPELDISNEKSDIVRDNSFFGDIIEEYLKDPFQFRKRIADRFLEVDDQ